MSGDPKPSPPITWLLLLHPEPTQYKHRCDGTGGSPSVTKTLLSLEKF